MSLRRKQIFLLSTLFVVTLVTTVASSFFKPAPASAFEDCTYTYSSSSVETIYIRCSASSRFGELNTSVTNINESSDPWLYQDATLIEGSGTEDNTGHAITIPDFENFPSQGSHSVFGNGAGGRVSQPVTVLRDENDSDAMWSEQQIEDLANPSELSAEDRNCENAGGLGWIMCPVIYVIDNAINWVDDVIESMLDIDQGYYDNDGIKGAWTAIRNIAYIILIPIMLVMVIGTAIGFQAIDAYTVKRALPRLVAAVIFISLSYTICVFMIEFVSALGRGVLGLLTAPFGEVIDINGKSVVLSELNLRSLFGPGLLTSIAGLAVGTIGLLFILWIFGGGLLLAAGAAFIVLMLRQVFIVALLLLAPLAILAWIFPGNDKLWKMWWNSFTKLLIMFPLIMGIIAVGRIFAFIIHESNPAGLDGAVVAPLMTLAAYMLPYAFIPFTFKVAGGVFSTITGGIDGFLNDPERKKRRYAKRAGKFQRMGNEAVFGGDGAFSRAANKTATWMAAPHKNFALTQKDRRIPMVSGYGRRLHSGIHASAVSQTGEFFKKLNTEVGQNDKAYRVLGGMLSGLSSTTQNRLVNAGLAERGADGVIRGKALTTEKKVNQAAEILARGTSRSEREAGAALRRAANVVGSRYVDPEAQYVSVAGAAALGLAAHGFYGKQDVADSRTAMMAETGDAGFADTMLVQSELYAKDSMPHVKPGYGHERDAQGNLLPDLESNSDMDAVATYGPAELGRVKEGHFDEMDGVYREALEYQTADAARRETLQRQLASDAQALDVIADNLLPQVREEFPDLAPGEIAKIAKEQAKADPRAREIVRRQKASKYSEQITDTLASAASSHSYASVGVKQRAKKLLEEAGLQDRLKRVEDMTPEQYAEYYAQKQAREGEEEH